MKKAYIIIIKKTEVRTPVFSFLRHAGFRHDLDNALVGEFFGYEFELGIPVLAEAADEGFLEELVDGEVLLLSLEHSHLAHVPAVVVEGTVGAILAYADRVEVARYGFVEGDTPLAVGALDGAVAAATLVVAGEHAVLAIDDGGHEFATGVVVGDALTLDDLAGLGQQFVPYLGQQGLDLFYLVGGDGCARVALDAAGTIATLKVAQKLLFEYVE